MNDLARFFHDATGEGEHDWNLDEEKRDDMRKRGEHNYPIRCDCGKEAVVDWPEFADMVQR